MNARTAAFERRLAAAIGVTRVARVTGLDRSGVEVACAVRPRGHVLQVSNGKGESFATARISALLEAAELWAAERVDGDRLVWGSLSELRERFGDDRVWDAADLGSAGGLVAPGLWSARTRCAWRWARELGGSAPGDDILVPARALYCLPPGATPLGPAVLAWTSNGSGAGRDFEAAVAHALLEAVERDQLARALPSGWCPSDVRERLLSPNALSRRAPRTAARVGDLRTRGFETYLFDLTPDGPDGAVGLPVAGALLVDTRWGPVPLTAGYACRLDWDSALLAALLEAAQSRLTDIHGAREDVSHAADTAPLLRLAQLCRAAEPRRRLLAPAARRPAPAHPPRMRGAVGFIVGRLRAAGHGCVAVADLAPRGSPVHVAKVVVPGLRISELLG